ncbi:glycosyltransferase family 2 protein [Chryseobacterium sp. A321]
MMQPLVSICCLAFNHEKYIRECLDGFIKQKCDFEFEILIHDDASTDGTQEIIKEYQLNYPKIVKPILQTENTYSKGIRATIEYNFPRAKGKYIAMCEGDDYWIDPLKLQKQVGFLEENSDYNFSVGKVLTIDEFGRKNKIHEFADPSKRNSYTLEDYITYRFSQTSSFLFRNDFTFPNFFKKAFSVDQALVICATKDKNIYFHDDIFSHYRINSSSVSFTTSQKERYTKMIQFWRDVKIFTENKYRISIFMNQLFIESHILSAKYDLYKPIHFIIKGIYIMRIKTLYKCKELFYGI